MTLEETLEAALEAGGVAAEPTVAAATPAAVSAADDTAPPSVPGPEAEEPNGGGSDPCAVGSLIDPEAPMDAADAEEPHGGGDAPPGIPGPTDDGDNCAICQVSLREDPDDALADSGLRGVPIAILPCLHMFHQCCIDETCRILEKPVATLACPTCRRTPQDIQTMEERMIIEGMARRAAEGLPHRAQAATRARQLHLDTMFTMRSRPGWEHAPKAHGQRCAGLDNP